jgi:hypothetical protein
MRFSIFVFGFSAVAITAPLTAQQVIERASVAPVAQAQVPTQVSAQAQAQLPAQVSVDATPAVTTGPTTETARAGIAPRESKTLTVNDNAAADRHVGAGQNVALMVVGGAALVTGLIIGGDGGTLLAVGGAVVGLFGLYNFVK